MKIKHFEKKRWYWLLIDEVPVDEQAIITPLDKSCSVIVIRKKCAACRSTVPDTVWPHNRVSTFGTSNPGTCVLPFPMCIAAVRTFWEISVGTGIPALLTKAPKSLPTVPMSSTLTLPNSATLPSSPCKSYCLWRKKMISEKKKDRKKNCHWVQLTSSCLGRTIQHKRLITL